MLGTHKSRESDASRSGSLFLKSEFYVRSGIASTLRSIEMRAVHHIQRSTDLSGLAEALDYIFATTLDAYQENGQWVTEHGRTQVHRAGNFSIQIYANEHPPPHFHIRGNDINASFSIDNFSPMEGCDKLPKKALRLIQYFYESGGRAKLIDCWNRTRPFGCEVGEIEQDGESDS
jgi:hypothetical protein